LLADQKQPDGLLASVLVPVGAALAARERENLAFGNVLPAVGGANGQRPAEDDQQLLALQVVVEVYPLAGRELVDGQAEVVGAGHFTESGTAEPTLVGQLGRVNVGHPPSLGCPGRHRDGNRGAHAHPN
jgi:hypothetical protein